MSFLIPAAYADAAALPPALPVPVLNGSSWSVSWSSSI